MGVVSHWVYIVKIVFFEAGGTVSFAPQSGVKWDTQIFFFHLLKTSTKCLGSTKTVYCLLKNASAYINTCTYPMKLSKRKVYNLIYKNYINKLHTLQKLHNFFENVLQNARSMKTYVSFQFSKQEKYVLYRNNV